MKWNGPVKCPECGSGAVRRRELVHKAGTSVFSGKSSSSGFSFGIFGRARPRVWFGSGRHSGQRQSFRAREAQPLPLWPAILLPALIFLFQGQGQPFEFWSWAGFIVSGFWLMGALSDWSNYKEQWLCNKCGARFTPAKAVARPTQYTAPPPESHRELAPTDSPGPDSEGKNCSICGIWHPHYEYIYGNRSNRSYCRKCNREERAAYAEGGVDAARRYREEKRRQVQNSKG